MLVDEFELGIFWCCDYSGIREEYCRNFLDASRDKEGFILRTVQDCVGIIQGRVDCLTN